MDASRVISPPAGARAWLYTYGGQVHRPHRHRELELNLVVRGSATYLINNQRFDLQPHTLLWLHPAHAHVLLEQSPDYQMWVLLFSRELLAQACTTPATAALRQDRPADVPCKHLPAHETEPLATFFGQIVRLRDEVAEREGGTQEAEHLHLSGMRHALLWAWTVHRRAYERVTQYMLHPAVECAVRLLRESETPPALDELAAQGGLSPAWLSRLFKQQTGVSISRFRNQQKLNRFLELYGHGHRLNMTEAAYRAGFGSYAQFHRVFRQLMACGPAEHYRHLGRADS